MKIIKPDQGRFLKALIFGPAGAGKTHFLGTAQLDPRTSPVLFLDFEGGSQTLAGLDIDMVEIRDWDTYSQVYSELESPRSNLPYQSICIDSLSETHIFTLLDILEGEQARRNDPNALQQQDYGKATVQMRRFVRSFRDLPMHVFMTSLSKEVVEPRVGAVKVPALAGQLAEELPGLFDVAGYFAISQERGSDGTMQETRSLLLSGFSQFRVKARTRWGDVIPEYLDDPTVTKLLDVLHFPGGPPAETPAVRAEDGDAVQPIEKMTPQEAGALADEVLKKQKVKA